MKFLATFLLLFISTIASAQFEDYYAAEDLYGGFIFVEDELFLSFPNRLSKIDINDPTQTEVMVFDMELPTRFMSLGDQVLVVEQFGEGRIASFDPAETNPVLKDISIEGLEGPSSIALFGDLLFVSDFAGDKISVVDMTADFPTPAEEILTGFNGPNGMLRFGDDIYVAISLENKIIKITNTNGEYVVEDVVQNLNWPYSLIQIGDEIFCSNMNDDAIFKFKPIDPQATFEVVYNLPKPTAILEHEGHLYVTLRDEDKIVRTTAPVNIVEEDLKNKLLLYPNPVDDYLVIKSFKGQGVAQIVNTKGQLIKEVYIEGETPILVDELSTGIYFLKIEGRAPLRFIKY